MPSSFHPPKVTLLSAFASVCFRKTSHFVLLIDHVFGRLSNHQATDWEIGYLPYRKILQSVLHEGCLPDVKLDILDFFIFFFPELTWICIWWKLLLREGKRKCHTVQAHCFPSSTTVELHAWEDTETQQAMKDHVSLHVSLIPPKIQWNIIK